MAGPEEQPGDGDKLVSSEKFERIVEERDREAEENDLEQVALEPRDPWAHRSAGMRCRTCMWFTLKGDTVLGRCRKRAPTMNGYPVVFVHDWCGDHKLDETKVTTTA